MCTLCPPDFPQTASVPGRAYLEAGVGLGPCGSPCAVQPSVLERSFPCVGAVTGLLGNILKVKCVHLDSSGDRGADSGPIGMLWPNEFIAAFMTLKLHPITSRTTTTAALLFSFFFNSKGG